MRDANDAARDELLAEAALMANLNHPKYVSVIGCIWCALVVIMAIRVCVHRQRPRSSMVPTSHAIEPVTSGLTSPHLLFLCYATDSVLSLVGVCTRGLPKMMLVPFCSNGSLLDFLQKMFVALSLEVKLAIIKDVAAGMAYLVANQLVHRDLAARNVLVADDFSCKVRASKPSVQLPAPTDLMSV